MRIHSLLATIVLAVALTLGAAPANAQSREVAQLSVRIQQLEEQIRLLTGQVEGLQFQLTQMQAMLERQSEDNEFRFQQLEGGGGSQQGAVEPDRLPPDPTQTAALPQPAPAADELGADELGAPLHDDLAEIPADDLGGSADPLVGSNAPGTGTLGSLEATAPLDLSLDGGSRISSGDANAQYQAGYEAIMRGDYAFAEGQFQQFIQLYPNDPQAPDATNWLGEALMQRGAYDEAAITLAEGYQKYQDAPRAPELMLKLGIALAGLGQQDDACRTFYTVERRHTDIAPNLMQRLQEEKSRNACPA